MRGVEDDGHLGAPRGERLCAGLANLANVLDLAIEARCVALANLETFEIPLNAAPETA